MNPFLAEAVGALFGSRQYADCVVVFVRDSLGPLALPAKRGASEGQEVLAEPLPAHSFVLGTTTGYFSGKVSSPLK
jgi:hypothetical protein